MSSTRTRIFGVLAAAALALAALSGAAHVSGNYQDMRISAGNYQDMAVTR
jgi:hypothetical protein